MVSKIRGWIDECTEHHDRCVKYTQNQTFVPKRLINLKGHCRLESAESPVQYAALSYCWGRIEQPSTTKFNVALREYNLQYEELPQTLQDAILMTRMLGLDYLWIDAICIVQDDKEEWASEAARMGEIYSMAHIVLAATAANSATEGFLRPRDRLQKISSLVDPKNPFTVNARVVDTHDYDGGHIGLNKQPLSKRGWALQERALARRTVHFLRDEALFECRSSVICECGHLFHGHPYTSMAWLPDGEDLHAQVDLMWRAVVGDFTQRSLTHADDALPALSGMAQRILSLNPGRYFAGLWEREISHQLGWMVEPHLWAAGDRDKNPRPRPTFSWATFPGPVSFTFLSQPLCTLHSGNVVSLTSDMYGRVKEAFIQMRGRTMSGRNLVSSIEHLNDAKVEYSRKPSHVSIQIDGMHPVLVDPDSDDPQEILYEDLEAACDWDTVLCFILGKEHGHTISMLILQEVSGEDAFERIGIVIEFPDHAMDNLSPERIVTIV